MASEAMGAVGVDFDFDAWFALARNDPEAFERRRLAAIEEMCESMGPRRNRRLLAGTCWRIEMERARAKTPLQCCIRLSSMMWDSFHDLAKALDEWPRCAEKGKAPVHRLKKPSVK